MEMEMPDLTRSTAALVALGSFAFAYAFVIPGEFTGLRKSKPVVFAAGVLWSSVAPPWKRVALEGNMEERDHA